MHPEEAPRALCDSLLPDAAFVVVAVAVGLRWSDWVQKMISDPDAIFSALAGVHAALLGFVLAALTIVLGYAQSSRFDVVRAAGHFPTLFQVYLAAVRTYALALVLCLGAVLIDSGDRTGAVSTGLVSLSTGLALLRLARVIWVTELVVAVIVRPTRRAPGASRGA